MWKELWQTWTIDKPAALGDWLWDAFVVRLAAFLDRLTLRQLIAFIPVVILVLAYYHRIPIPPELLLVSDLLAYIDIFAVLFLLGVLSRVATVVFIIKQARARAVRQLASLLAGVPRLDVRYRREPGVKTRKRKAPKQLSGRADDGDERGTVRGLAWA